MRFIDEIINKGFQFENNIMPVVFNVSNIFQYYFQRQSDEPIEFPNLAPPFNFYFMEAKAPAWLMIEGKRINWVGSPKWGVLFRAYADPLYSLEKGGWRKIIEHCRDPKQIKWIIKSIIFLENRPTSSPDLMGQIIYALDNLGKRIDLGNEEYYLFSLLPHQLEKTPDLSDKQVAEGCLQYLAPFEWATCFLHCKNVKISDVIPEEKLNILHEQKYGHPLMKYKILNITPARKIGTTDHHIPEKRSNQALHICRGHFKLFEERPLFGKYSGLYWWESQIRGNKKRGIILKDYEINKE